MAAGASLAGAGGATLLVWRQLMSPLYDGTEADGLMVFLAVVGGLLLLCCSCCAFCYGLWPWPGAPRVPPQMNVKA